MKMITTLAYGAAMAFAAIPFASPAMAQGTTGVIGIAGNGSCPDGYTRGSSTGNKAKKYPNPELCYPETDNPPSVYKKSATGDACPSGMRSESSTSVWCTTQTASAVYTPPTYGSIKKANAFDRCPVGYHTSEPDVMECVSYDYAAGKQPLTRASKGKPCAADEVDEWGLWCTSKVTQLTRAEAENEAIADVNHIFPRDGKGGNQGANYENTPGIVGIFGPKGSAKTADASPTSGDQPAAQQTAQCTTDSGAAAGAAIGGAVGGDAGAAIGGMLGGLGKKKKKKTC
jgi:hypothetical protein